MTTIHIENEYSLKEALRSGVNLFLGAGFSVLAKNRHGNFLPVGDALSHVLKNAFPKIRDSSLPLPQLTAILAATQKADFEVLLTDQYTVTDFDKRYDVLRS